MAKTHTSESHYRRLLVMTVISFVAMYVLMYAMVNTFENVHMNVNQFYMAGLMTASMVIIEVAIMRAMYQGDNTWTLRDATGQPLWSSSQTEPRGFWTTKRVILAIVVVKVAALATVLRH